MRFSSRSKKEIDTIVPRMSRMTHFSVLEKMLAIPEVVLLLNLPRARGDYEYNIRRSSLLRVSKNADYARKSSGTFTFLTPA